MPRIVSVWLPRWPILRFLAAQARAHRSDAPVDPARPFVLAADVSGTPRITAANAAAEQDGIRIGEALADARAKTENLQVRAADPAADDAALRQLALWATRYTPAVAAFDQRSGADGLFLDVTGASHLFGGEAKLIADLEHRLAQFGLPARLAAAATAGAAWALARFSVAPHTILAAGEESAALAPLPIEALRLSSETRATLRRLGFRRVGALIDNPRAPFAARFERELLLRMDQALGRTAEPLCFILPPPVYHSLRYLMEPLVAQEAVIAVARRLMQDIVHALTRDGVGARTLRLALYRVDGGVTSIDIGLTRATRSVPHVARLIELKLERKSETSAETLDAGFGFEAIGLAIAATERIEPGQTELLAGLGEAGADEADERCAELIDGLTQRLGPRSVQRLAPVASHLPERAETSLMSSDDRAPWPAPDEARPRPLLLFAHAEPAEVMAQVPEGPPRRFRWRGVLHGVAKAQGPERIATEWWRSSASLPTRDYYLVEDEAGRRFWLYREGLYARETVAPRWFVHGLFA
jgi:protein ImuB